jgi:hypothetical protein
MITALTQNKPDPVYFNEPLSMGQKQCEKFYYLNLLKKISHYQLILMSLYLWDKNNVKNFII